MRRRSPFLRSLRNRPHHSSARLILFATAFALLLAAFAALNARAQDATPPPPPPDQPAAPAETPGQSQVRAVRLSDVEGQVRVYEGSEVAFDQAEPNMPAVEGMRLVTGDNGRFEIEFEDGSVARVTPDSSIRLTQLRRNADGSTVTQVDALTGLSYYELNGRGGEYSVHFGPNTATPVQSAVFRVGLDTAPSTVAVMHGAVHIDDGMGLSMDVHPSQTFQTDLQQPGEFTIAQNVTADTWDQWNSDRDESLARLETNQSMARASSGNPDNPAWNDLDYYGNWYNLPGYGQAWAPIGCRLQLGSLRRRRLGLLPGRRIHLDLRLSLGLVAVSLRRLELHGRLRLDVVSRQLRLRLLRQRLVSVFTTSGILRPDTSRLLARAALPSMDRGHAPWVRACQR